MALWLLIIGLFAALWFALAPRTQKTRESLALRMPFVGAGRTQREKFKLALNDAAAARGATLNGATASDFSAWLDSLSNKQLDRLMRQVAAACRRADVNLNWLLDNRAQGEMQNALQDTVLLAALAMYRAHAVEPFARLEAYRQNPNARGNRKFGQQVFAKLVASQSITIPANLMLASEKERRAYANQMIEQAAQENQDAVIAVVRETMGAKNEKGAANGAAAKMEPTENETKALTSSTANAGV
jgi:hypothetical protein